MNKLLKSLPGHLLLVSLLLTVSSSCGRHMEKLETGWARMCASENGAQERKAVDNMSKLISEAHGSFGIYLVTSDGRKVNLADLGNREIPFETVQMDVHWGDDKHFVGTGWVPRDKGNIDAFLLE